MCGGGIKEIEMLGVYQVGDSLKGLYNDHGAIAVVGRKGVTEIVVDKANGPMGFYAVANIFKGDDLVSIVHLHMCSVVDT
jgi:hypothetical protein